MDDKPVAVTLRFRNERDRNYFMAGLSDGWGEGWCDLIWPWESYPEEEVRSGRAFEACESFDVTVFRDERDEEESSESFDPRDVAILGGDPSL